MSEVKNCPDCGCVIEDEFEMCDACKSREQAFESRVTEWKERNK